MLQQKGMTEYGYKNKTHDIYQEKSQDCKCWDGQGYSMQIEETKRNLE